MCRWCVRRWLKKVDRKLDELRAGVRGNEKQLSALFVGNAETRAALVRRLDAIETELQRINPVVGIQVRRDEPTPKEP